jgi:hypothetical protein
MILSTLRYASYMSHTQEVERKKMAEKDKEQAENDKENGNGGAQMSLPAQALEVAGAEGVLAAEGGEKGFVSLG